MENNRPKFIIYYNDNSKFTGMALEGDWKKIDQSKKILKVDYFIGKAMVTLEGYKQYNHFREMMSFGTKGMARILLMGRRENSTDVFFIDFIQKRMYKQVKPIYKEYGRQILANWQEGVLSNPQLKVNGQNVR